MFGGVNNFSRDYQTIGYDNYGYGIYSQDLDVYRNPYTGHIDTERDVGFIPLGNSPFQPYENHAVTYHQHCHH